MSLPADHSRRNSSIMKDQSKDYGNSIPLGQPSKGSTTFANGNQGSEEAGSRFLSNKNEELKEVQQVQQTGGDDVDREEPAAAVKSSDFKIYLGVEAYQNGKQEEYLN